MLGRLNIIIISIFVLLNRLAEQYIARARKNIRAKSLNIIYFVLPSHGKEIPNL